MDISNKIIQIAKVEQTAKTLKLSDQNGDKYTLWIKKQDGNPTQAYEQWKAMDVLVGNTVEVSFKPEAKEFVNAENKKVKYTERTVIGFREANPLPDVEVKSKPIRVNPEHEILAKPDWDAITRGKIATNLAQGYLAGGKSIPELEADMTGILRTADSLMKLSATYEPEDAFVTENLEEMVAVDY